MGRRRRGAPAPTGSAMTEPASLRTDRNHLWLGGLLFALALVASWFFV